MRAKDRFKLDMWICCVAQQKATWFESDLYALSIAALLKIVNGPFLSTTFHQNVLSWCTSLSVNLQAQLPLFIEFLWTKSSRFNCNPCNLIFCVTERFHNGFQLDGAAESCSLYIATLLITDNGLFFLLMKFHRNV